MFREKNPQFYYETHLNSGFLVLFPLKPENEWWGSYSPQHCFPYLSDLFQLYHCQLKMTLCYQHIFSDWWCQRCWHFLHFLFFSVTWLGLYSFFCVFFFVCCCCFLPILVLSLFNKQLKQGVTPHFLFFLFLIWIFIF